MHIFQPGEGRRKFGRFSPRGEFFVYVKSGKKFVLGRLVDIGMGGLSLKSLSDCSEQDIAEMAGRPCDLGIFLSSRQFFLSGIQSSFVYVLEQTKDHFSFLGSKFKRCGLCFESLDQDQERALLDFMKASQLKRVG